MHEFSTATSIVGSVLEFAEAQAAGEILKVRVRIGELTCVEEEQLRFCYEAITKETKIENSTLEIESVSAVVSCPFCSYEGPPKYWEDALAESSIPTLQCPGCGKAAEATEGHECEIKSVQFVR